MQALFFGPPRPQGMKPTSKEILLETNGFDGPQQPQLLPSAGTYFDRQGNQFTFELGQVTLNPLNDLESRMQVPLSPGAPVIVADRRIARLDPAEVAQILQSVQSSMAIKLPEVATVDLRRCEVVIEPSIFFVRGSNFGDTWAGGMTEDLGNANYRLHVMVFYISSERRVADWREYLVSEAINFFVLSVGRRDLAR